MDKKKRLTAKQEKFVCGLVEGMSQRKAYLNAYPNSKKWKHESVDSRASNLFNTDKVLARYDELMEKATEESIITSKEMQKMYSDILLEKRKFKDYHVTLEGEIVEKEVPTKLSDWNKTSELLMKLQGAYVNKVEMDTTIKTDKLGDILEQLKD